MTGEKRREMIIRDIKKSNTPLSGTELAKRYEVSRQIVVQDVALLRAEGHDIMSTTKGYTVNHTPSVSRIFHVTHDDDGIQEELNTIVDLGGHVIDIFVEHHVYGRLNAVLNIGSRRDVENFMTDLFAGQATPLSRLTGGDHWHTVEADNNEILDLIGESLGEKGFSKS